MKLNVKLVRTLTKPGRYGDGRGLYLQITKTGGKSWLFRYMLRGHRPCMGLGPVDLVSLEQARHAATDARRLVKSGTDPLAARRNVVAVATAAKATFRTFKQAADEFYAAKSGGWKNEEHRLQWRNSVARYVVPILGDLPVDAIGT